MADDFKHGTMDTSIQEKTFGGFVRAMTWTAIVVVVVLVLLAIFNG
jgi:uncharacterized integral membrane protein